MPRGASFGTVKALTYFLYMENANTQIQPFIFNSNQVRIKIINDTEYFCAKDVCNILGYSNGRKAIQDNCKEKGVTICDTLTNGGIQKLTFINEANLLRLIVKSKLPEAEKFEAWVFEEILPTIRKTGKFEAPQLTQKEQVLLLAKNLLQAEEEKERLQIENTKQEQIIERFIEAKEHKNYTETADIIGMPRNQFIEYLRSNSYIEKHTRRPTLKAKKLNIIETKWSNNGYPRFLVTPKGITYFKRKICNITLN